MTFEKGDRVRLKAKPEIVGKIVGEDNLPTGLLKFRPDVEIAGWWCVLRFPEELEYAPEPIQVGDLVRHVSGTNGRVDGINGDAYWVHLGGKLWVTWFEPHIGKVS